MSAKGLSQAPGNEIYEVERILKKRYHPNKGVLYFVKWRNYPNSANTWEPACNFSQKLIEIYEAKRARGKKSNPVASSSSSIASSSSSTISDSNTNNEIYNSKLDSVNTSNTSTSDHLIPSTSLALSSSASTTTTISNSSVESHDTNKRGRGRPKKTSSQRRQQQVQLQSNIQEKQKNHMPSERQQLAVFNAVGNHYLPIVKEVVYEPKLTKEPIVVTDVTTKNLTVTIIECQEPEGFFSK